jgi:hypothetical protein
VLAGMVPALPVLHQALNIFVSVAQHKPARLSTQLVQALLQEVLEPQVTLLYCCITALLLFYCLTALLLRNCCITALLLVDCTVLLLLYCFSALLRCTVHEALSY